MKRNKISREDMNIRKDNMLVNVVWDYFNKENLGTSKTWRETLLRYRVYKAFDKCFWKRDGDFNMNEVIIELRNILPEMKKLVRLTNDGSIPYGSENDYGNLCYVSDRWFCEGRLTWLIQLAERNWTYKKCFADPEYPDYETWEPFKDCEFLILKGKEIKS